MLENLIGRKLYEEIPSYALKNGLKEIRIRLGKPVTYRTVNGDRGRLLTVGNKTIIDNIVAIATQNSRYIYEDEISRGYLSYDGGYRIGIGGLWVEKNGRPIEKEICSLVIRIPHQVLGAAEKISHLLNDFQNTLIVSPPSGGKTTLLRDAIRVLSANYEVLAIDERFEISGGIANMNLGDNTDIIAGVPKTLVYEGIIRALSPEVVAIDELFGKRDCEAVADLIGCGVKVIATMHGKSLKDVENRLKSTADMFENIIFLNSIPMAGHIDSIVRR